MSTILADSSTLALGAHSAAVALSLLAGRRVTSSPSPSTTPLAGPAGRPSVFAAAAAVAVRPVGTAVAACCAASAASSARCRLTRM